MHKLFKYFVLVLVSFLIVSCDKTITAEIKFVATKIVFDMPQASEADFALKKFTKLTGNSVSLGDYKFTTELPVVDLKNEIEKQQINLDLIESIYIDTITINRIDDGENLSMFKSIGLYFNSSRVGSLNSFSGLTNKAELQCDKINIKDNILKASSTIKFIPTLYLNSLPNKATKIQVYMVWTIRGAKYKL